MDTEVTTSQRWAPAARKAQVKWDYRRAQRLGAPLFGAPQTHQALVLGTLL